VNDLARLLSGQWGKKANGRVVRRMLTEQLYTNKGLKVAFTTRIYRYIVKLNPLDGVYYYDIRPNMQREGIPKNHIKTFAHLLVEDIWQFRQ
jgi:hypothetical protein